MTHSRKSFSLNNLIFTRYDKSYATRIHIIVGYVVQHDKGSSLPSLPWPLPIYRTETQCSFPNLNWLAEDEHVRDVNCGYTFPVAYTYILKFLTTRSEVIHTRADKIVYNRSATKTKSQTVLSCRVNALLRHYEARRNEKNIGGANLSQRLSAGRII